MRSIYIITLSYYNSGGSRCFLRTRGAVAKKARRGGGASLILSVAKNAQKKVFGQYYPNTSGQKSY